MSGNNVNPGEVAHFDELAGRWWDPEGDLKTLHDINPLRLEFILGATPVEGIEVLDVGCGGGILAESLAAAGARVTGIDLAPGSIEVARLHGLESGIDVDYRLASAEQHAADHVACYDLVTCMEMLEHVPDPASVIGACAGMLKPGGSLYLSTLNRTLKSLVLGVIAAEYILNIVPRGTHDHGRFIRPSELCRWCRSAGLDLSTITGIHYNPASRKASPSRDVSINYMARFVRRPDSSS